MDPLLLHPFTWQICYRAQTRKARYEHKGSFTLPSLSILKSNERGGFYLARRIKVAGPRCLSRVCRVQGEGARWWSWQGLGRGWGFGGVGVVQGLGLGGDWG